MLKINYSGRFGNILLENVGISIISKKFNLKVSHYQSVEDFKILGLSLFQGERIFENIVNCYDIELSHVTTGPYGTLIDLMRRQDDIDSGILYDGNFQVKEFVKDYRHEILSHFDLKYDEVFKNDLFIHIRLGDVTQYNPGIDYYRKCISMVDYQRIFLSTDSPNHPMISTLLNEYKISMYNDDEVSTLNFGKNFGNLILSKGTFSWWIGILSKAKKIFYPTGLKPWHGDIFVFDEWTPVNINN